MEVSSSSVKPRRRRIRSELDRLLSDEGTRNMLKGINKKPLFRKKKPAVAKKLVKTKPINEIDYNIINITHRANIAFITISFKNSGFFTTNVLKSLDASIQKLDQDESVDIITVQNSNSSYFCNGIDLHELIINNNHNHCNLISKSIKSLISTLNSCKSVTVASIRGDCVGIGIMLLPLFDMVYASDKSMFRMHYNKLNQPPECVALLQNLLNGNANGKITSLLYMNTPLTSEQAYESGLITESIWTPRYEEELTSRLNVLGSSNVIKTKNLIKQHKRVKLADIVVELNQIETRWNTLSFQQNLKQFINRL